MANNGWQKIEEIFHNALALPRSERKEYIKRSTMDEHSVFVEVENLISAYEAKSDFLETPALDLGFNVIDLGNKRRADTVLGNYKIGRKIGSGGMGDVYEAIDTKLNRKVALKFLSDYLKDNKAAQRQLHKEAQAVAKLDHPSICAVYGIETIENEHFIVMQFIEGITLEQSLRMRTVDLTNFKSLASQIAVAVAFAHSHGVIHRDLKPGNIMVSDHGNIKVLDFGLAKVVEKGSQFLRHTQENSTQFSHNGLIMGTISYMSPEQLRGEKLDYQTDIFSLGVIFYELLTKHNPFQRPTPAESIAAILDNTPLSLRVHGPELPKQIVGLVNRCIEKDKNMRFQSVSALLIELDNIGIIDEEKSGLISGQRKFAKVTLTIVLLLVVLTAFFLYLTPSRQITLALLPISFDGLQSEKDYLADEITQGIAEKLSNLSDVKIKGDYFTGRYKGKNVEPQTVGKELNAEAVFSGIVHSRSDGLFLETKTIRTLDGVLIDTNETRFEEADLVALPEETAARIIETLNLRLSAEDRSKLSKRDTDSIEAKNFYLNGRYYLKRRKDGEDLERAIQAFTNAKDIDQNYARAWAGLADAYVSQSGPGVKRSVTPGKAVELAKLAAKRALDLDNTLCDTYNSLGLISLRYDWNWSDAENYFRIAIERDHDFLPARFGLINVLKMQQRYSEALEEATKIKKLDPLSINSDIQIALIYYRKHDYGQTERILSELLQRSPDDVRVKYVQVYQFLKTERFKEAIDILEPMYDSKNQEDKVLAAAPLGFAYARVGWLDKASRIIESLEKFKKDNYVPAQEKALIYVALGNYDKVFENLKLSCSERFSSLPGWINDPIVDEIQTDPRFAEIRKCVNL